VAVVVTFDEFNDEDNERIAAAEREFGVTVERRSQPQGDENWLWVQHRDLSFDEVRSMRDLQGICLFDYGRATIPATLLNARGIVVQTVPSLSGLGVAEHAFALMLAIKKQVIAGHNAVVANEWRDGVDEPLYTDQRAHVFNWSGIENLGWLYGQTLGVVGFGRIGKALAKRALAFDMDVIYFNRRRLTRDEERRLGVEYADLYDLLARADVVSLHVPFNESTENLLGADEFQRMKRSAILINAARGRVVDEAALTEALRERTIAGAGIDVLTYEPPFPDNPILTLDNVVFSPHDAGVYDPLARTEQFRIAARLTRDGLAS
jgi:phosphoglycerate dehydrogenase-like enzyme